MSFISAKSAFQDVGGISVESSSPDWIRLQIAPDFTLKLTVVSFFRTHLLSGLSTELCEQLCVAIDELLANALEHGCKAAVQSGVELTYIRTSRSILLQLRDAGAGFSWNSLSHAAINNPVEDPLRHIEYRSKMGLRPGGFGILLIRQIADELIYNEYGNEVLFVKYL